MCKFLGKDNGLGLYSTNKLNTLFNIVEAWFENCQTLMSVLYDNQMDQ